jgi:hypothetical protein
MATPTIPRSKQLRLVRLRIAEELRVVRKRVKEEWTKQGRRTTAADDVELMDAALALWRKAR